MLMTPSCKAAYRRRDVALAARSIMVGASVRRRLQILRAVIGFLDGGRRRRHGYWLLRPHDSSRGLCASICRQNFSDGSLAISPFTGWKPVKLYPDTPSSAILACRRAVMGNLNGAEVEVN